MKHFARILLGAFLFVGFSFLNTSFAKEKPNAIKTEIVKDFSKVVAILDGQFIDVTPSDGQSITILPAKEVIPGLKPTPEKRANAPPLTKRRSNK